MVRVLAVAGLLAVRTQAYAPIQWTMSPSSMRFALAPAPLPSKASAPPLKLTMRESSDTVAHFTVAPDETITWDAMGWCIEAGSENHRHEVFIDYCADKLSQKWNVLTNRDGQQVIQLKGSTKCLDVIDREDTSNGASVELRECEAKATQSWTFGEWAPPHAKNPSQLSAFSIFLYAMALIGMMSRGAWLWRFQIRTTPMGRSSALSRANLGGVSLFMRCTMSHDSKHGMIPVAMAINPTSVDKDEVVIALIDGDSISKEYIKHSLQVLRRSGKTVQATLFGSPLQDTKKGQAWLAFMVSNEISFRPVDRKHYTLEDPNDTAIAAEVSRLINQSSIHSIALIAEDKDFVPVAQRIVDGGKKCTVFLSNHRRGRSRDFQKVGAVVHTIQMEVERSVSMKAVLHPDGRGSIVPLTEALHRNDDITSIISKMLELGFLHHERDPVMPALAKFWYSNGHGDLSVWPLPLAVAQVSSMLCQQSTNRWKADQGNLVFLLPVNASWRIANGANGGGPHMLRDSPSLGEDILVRLGYLDSTLNTDVDEAIDVFLHAGVNKCAALKAGIAISHLDSTHDKLSSLRKICLSSKYSGKCQVPPADTQIRRYFFAHGLLSKISATHEEVFDAMRRFARLKGLRQMNTYNGMMWRCRKFLSFDRDRCSRRG